MCSRTPPSSNMVRRGRLRASKRSVRNTRRGICVDRVAPRVRPVRHPSGGSLIAVPIPKLRATSGASIGHATRNCSARSPWTQGRSGSPIAVVSCCILGSSRDGAANVHVAAAKRTSSASAEMGDGRTRPSRSPHTAAVGSGAGGRMRSADQVAPLRAVVRDIETSTVCGATRSARWFRTRRLPCS